ncbi:type II toxin-antitoxin system PemK/MazF family toxin [Cyanobium sp. BA20m-p-22]|uniref:type II toxin-antitoxin system PemK/MazF family toxin n=1 Tax=Cyanobium sp. BA20m-p-22 TaxID=2823704 RepID=UPI0020CDB644|nr:type II toxin-antitoxin system PemK/MazF family toxin [Cyanobium sp. BA20m-p-22]MCP9909808.1 type II toxin-antitoxin system PemK/MazF family toxin [Cyanobium sp. BA20m-p-22]
MLSRGEIVLVPFPFTDGTSSKLRPALVVALSHRHLDVVVAFISSRLHGPPQDDELDILTSQPDFAISGLKVSSRLRLTRMTTLAMPLVLRRIGALPQSLQPDYQRRVQLMFG